MSEHMKVKGMISTDVRLTLVSTNLAFGKWVDAPKSSIGTNGTSTTNQAFEAQGRLGTATGTEGTVEYRADDGAAFHLSFDNPYIGDNKAAIAAPAGRPYSCSVDFPRSGSDITVTWQINKK